MKVTSTEPQKNNKHRISVFVDNEYAFSLDETDAFFHKIKPGREITQKEIENLTMEGNYTKARDKALDILSRKSVSEKELSDKLYEKGYDKAVVTEVIGEMKTLGYVDDFEYAKLFLEHCRMKMWGHKKISYEMKMKGISEDIIREVLSECDFHDDTDEVCNAVISKYGKADLKDIKTRAKITRYLASRGYDFSFIDSVYQRLIREVSDEH